MDETNEKEGTGVGTADIPRVLLCVLREDTKRDSFSFYKCFTIE